MKTKLHKSVKARETQPGRHRLGRGKRKKRKRDIGGVKIVMCIGTFLYEKQNKKQQKEVEEKKRKEPNQDSALALEALFPDSCRKGMLAFSMPIRSQPTSP